MPEFALTIHAPAPVEEVWKLLHDPARFPEWWEGVETVEMGDEGRYTMWPQGYPDYPMEQRLDVASVRGLVTISCLVSDLVFRWELHESGEETDIAVHVELPEQEAHRLAGQREVLESSLVTLADLAGRS